MNNKASHQALLLAAQDCTTITYGEIVGLARLTLTGEDAFWVSELNRVYAYRGEE